MRTTMKTVLSAMAVTAGLAAAIAPPTAAVAAPAPQGGYVATIQMVTDDTGVPNGEVFRVQLVERQDIRDAFEVLRGRSNAHVNGKIVRTPSPYNPGYNWHLDPNDVDFAHISIELCDGQPSFLSEDWWGSERFCPWQGKVVKMERVRR
ncbi:hypothetical protein AB0M36_17265 [Actinoplanes sp. NPDC051346]|uniref:BP74-related protein n=1 Tax=Actinoplanes sp. NPDC051346 TaxID=3155048 RepID=UPI0034442740